MLALLTLNVGVATTARVSVLNRLGQLPLNPVMLYTVVDAGFRFCEAPDKFPGFQEYVPAPLAVISVDVPEQMEPLFTLTVGVGVTFTLSVFVSVQVELLPVIV
jgi:hypothetical protein